MDCSQIRFTLLYIATVCCILLAASNHQASSRSTGPSENPVIGVSNDKTIKRSRQDEYIQLIAQFDDDQEEQASQKQYQLSGTSSNKSTTGSILSLFTQRLDFKNGTGNETSGPLSGNFLNFFDELLQFNNNGVETLSRLNYFNDPRAKNKLTANYSSQRRPNPLARPNQNVVFSYNSPPKVGFSGNSNTNRTAHNGPGQPPQMSPNGTAGPNTYNKRPESSFSPIVVQPAVINQDETNKLAEPRPLTILTLAQRLNNLFVTLNEKINLLFSRLTSKLLLIRQRDNYDALGVSSNNIDLARDDDVGQEQVDSRLLDETATSNDGRRLITAAANTSDVAGRRLLIKRQVVDDRDTTLLQTEMMQRGRQQQQFQQPQGACIPLNPNQLNKCKSIEMTVQTNLNLNLPEKIPLIEENCRHLVFLFTTCWPNQLESLNANHHIRNEISVAASDYALAGQAGGSLPRQTTQVSCGTEPQVPDRLLDRFNWMWLNLCMDKRFRADYVDNTKCLSLWNQEKAHQACSNEYRRMQASLLQNPSVAQFGANNRIMQDQQQASSFATPVVSPNQVFKNDKMIEAMERELESKTLCCTFDVFLRCVYKQATRDCGRSGAQFIVNFMARIGTDDMKYLCNNRQLQPGPPGSGPITAGLRAGDHKGPFIDGSYCADPRIFTKLYGPLNTLNSTNKGIIKGATGGGNNLIGNLRNRQPGASNNYDSNYFNGAANEATGGASSSSLNMISILLPWAMAISFNTFLLNMIFNFGAN